MEEDCQVLGLINHVVDSDAENHNIFEPESVFSGGFNSFLNQWGVKSMYLGSMLFPKFLKCSKLMHIQNSILNTTTKLKCHK